MHSSCNISGLRNQPSHHKADPSADVEINIHPNSDCDPVELFDWKGGGVGCSQAKKSLHCFSEYEDVVLNRIRAYPYRGLILILTEMP